MLFKYFYDKSLAHASYLVGCQKTNEAIIVDPGRDIQQYLLAADKAGMKIIGAAETHIHADYVSGARELAHRTGAKLFLSDEGPAEWKYLYAQEYDHQLLKDGDAFFVGKVEFQVMSTPGHTPESISFILTDKGGGADEPMGIFTGDFVFVGSIGRPDLLEEAAGIANTAEPGARDLYCSIQRFNQLPDYLQVWPAHGAGSACGKGLGSIPSSTVGYEKRFNPALQYTDEQSFVDYILSEQPEAPKYFALMKRVNKEGPAILGESVLPPKLDPENLMETVANQFVVDTSPAKQFVNAHVPGTISVQPSILAMWASSVIDYDQPVFLIASEQVLPEFVRVMRKIGIENIGGYFDDTEVTAGNFKTASIPEQTPAHVFQQAQAGELEIIDVRGLNERFEFAIPGSTHEFLGSLPHSIEVFDRDKTYAFHCRTGPRSTCAASIARRAGIKNVINLEGGMSAVRLSDVPLISESNETIGSQ